MQQNYRRFLNVICDVVKAVVRKLILHPSISAIHSVGISTCLIQQKKS